MDPIGFLFVAGGIYMICGALFDWDFFMNQRSSRRMVSMLGRGGARVFFGLLGMVIVIVGTAIAMGLVTG